jgi:hypothetical protein
VTEQRERLERALRGCAEAGVPEPVDLWPAVRERVSGHLGEGRSTNEGRVGDEGRRWSRPVSNAPLALVLAILSMMILGAVVYIAAGSLQGPARHGTPTREKHAEQDRGVQSGELLSGLRTEVGQTRTSDGMRVTLMWAYADERFVAVGLDTQRLDGSSGSEEPGLEPSLWDDTVGDESKFPPYVKITDASGQDFDTVGGGTRGERADVTFDAPKGLGPGGHRFRLEVPIGTAAGGMQGEEPKAGPFFFDFEVPVLPAPSIEVNQEVEAKGITLTLERVIDSPLLPQAVVCFEPPDDAHSWTPFLPYDESYEKGVGSAPQELGNGCWSLQMVASESLSPVTVTNLEGFPNNLPSDPRKKAGAVNPKTIHGPWRFDFEAPEMPGS